MLRCCSSLAIKLAVKSSKRNITFSSILGSSRQLFDKEYEESIKNPEKFWGEKAKLIEWYKKPEKILDNVNSPFEKWFVNGELNAAYNCLDIHVKNGFGNQVAIIHDSPVTNTITKITYKELYEEVSKFAGVLNKHGVNKNDRVLIYMPMVPQAIVAMLASARLGAIHSLVFGGFASKELSTRINHAKPKIIVSANAGVEPGRIIDYKILLDQAVEMSDHKPMKCIFYNRKMFPPIKFGTNENSYYLDYENELDKARAHDCVPVDSNHPLYLLYTSGTTGTPKAVVRSTAGYLVSLKYSMSAFYGVKEGETWWASSDLGWTVGHSYVCYGPLAARNSSVLYEGKPIGTPDAGAYFRVLSEHKVVSMFVAPTAIRAIHQNDPKGSLGLKYPLDHFRYMFVAGEHCDHETMNWIKNVVKRPAFDHWWQTETGWPITSTCVGMLDKETINLIPNGVSGKPVPGYDVRILKDDNSEAKSNELGRIVIKMPLPPGTILTLWENDDLFKTLYFKTYKGYYDTMDVGYKNEDGFITVLSRADDVINVAGHRISAAAIEEAILESEELADCAVVSLKDSLKGDVPFAFVCITNNCKKKENIIIDQVIKSVRDSIGPVASFKQAVIVKKLPKTRSGKIARNCLKAMLNNQSYKIPVTIEDANVFNEIKQVLLKNGYKNISDPTP